MNSEAVNRHKLKTVNKRKVNGKGRSVLVVDNDDKFSEGCKRILAEAGFSAEVATDPRDGLANAKAKRFDVIVLDLNMPEVNGIQILNSLRQDVPDTPVVVITG